MRNNKKGFTLSEMLMVIAIIVILSGATAIGVVSWLNNAKNTAARLEQNNGDNFEKDARGEVESVRGTAGSHVVQQTNLNTPAPTAAPTSKPTDKPTSKPTDRPTAAPTSKPTTTPEATPTPVPDDDDVSGGNTSNGMTITTGAGNGTKGVIGFTTDGNKTNFTVTGLNGHGEYTMSITKQGNNYVLDMGSVMYQINYAFPGYNYNGNQSVYTLTSEQKTWLTSNYGITFS